MDELSELSKKTNSVNTVFKKNNKVVGENTDVFGFTESIKHQSIDLKNKTALVLGGGGVVFFGSGFGGGVLCFELSSFSPRIIFAVISLEGGGVGGVTFFSGGGGGNVFFSFGGGGGGGVVFLVEDDGFGGDGMLVLNGTDSSSTNAGDNFDLEGATGITV